ncbi:MAG: hypothetical protein GW787_04450 [Betaproteobacteria bacterium]|nr:hypothetical protein [Betaproteobacteria bacterium]
MRLRDTEFAKEMMGVVLSTLFVVASIAAITLTAILGCDQGVGGGCATSALVWHLT